MKSSVKKYIQGRADQKRWRQGDKDIAEFNKWYLSAAKNEGYIPNVEVPFYSFAQICRASGKEGKTT